MMRIAFAFGVLGFASIVMFSGDSPTMASGNPKRPQSKLVFLTQDAPPDLVGAGCQPEVIRPLAEYHRLHHPNDHVVFDLRLLERARVPHYYIYDRRWLPPIGKTLGANLFVMTRIRTVGPKHADPCEALIVSVEVKAYSSISDAESVIFSASKLSSKAAAEILLRNPEQTIKDILSVAEQEPVK
jgi:hypothetical protein